MWVTRWDFKSREDVQRAVRWCATVGMNRVFFQVRGRADAFYRSALEPWGEELGGIDPGFDPLATAIEEAHKVGIQLHAWINLLPGWKGSQSPKSRNHIFHRRPEWFLLDSKGRRHLRNAGGYTILNPCLPEVRDYLVAVVSDIVSRYAVDGVQLDYVRFIARDTRVDGDFPFDPRSLALFQQYSGTTPARSPAQWSRWRTLAVNTALYSVAQTIRARRPGCVVSVAAIADYERARSAMFQDVVKWQERRWVDEVYPMAYADDLPKFRTHMNRILRETPKGARVYPGIGVYRHGSAALTMQQVDLCRRLGVGGYCLFAYASLFPSPSHAYQEGEEYRRLRADLRLAVYNKNRTIPPPALSDARSMMLANPPNRRR